MEELLTHREKVGSLERDILNLDSQRRRLKRYGGLLKLDEQLEALYNDAANGKPFVSSNGPDEDEVVSTCIY